MADQKIGRHSRAASNKMQSQRSAKNKARNIARNPESIRDAKNGRGAATCAGKAQHRHDQAQRPSRIPALNVLQLVKVQRVKLQRHIANPDANPLASDDPIAVLARTNPKAPPAAWKLAAEQSFRKQRAAALRPLGK